MALKGSHLNTSIALCYLQNCEKADRLPDTGIEEIIRENFMSSVQVVTSTTKAASYDASAKPFLALGANGAIPQGGTGTQL